MKYSLILVLFILSLSFSVAKVSSEDLFTLIVDGLGCPFCAYGLEKKLQELDKVDNIEIEIELGKVSFSSPSNKILLKQIKEQVEKAGYTPIEILVLRGNGETEKLNPVK